MEIWDYDSYSSGITSIFSHSIIEYDLKSANTSVAKEFKLLPSEIIKKLEALGKHEREVNHGLIVRDNKEYGEASKQGFKDARRIFFETNHIGVEDVLSIKKDAIFTLCYVDKEQVTKNLNFRMKNEYSSFVQLNVEVFYNQEKGLDIKGIDDDIYEQYHKDYFGDFIYEVIRRKEISDHQEMNEFISKFWSMYKWRQLDPGYYREFNARSNFHYLNGSYAMEEYMEDLSQVDISFNMDIIMKLLQLVL